jgi:hypothetical protein
VFDAGWNKEGVVGREAKQQVLGELSKRRYDNSGVLVFAGLLDGTIAPSICSNGFAVLNKTDDGYFAKGVYVTFHSAYAAIYGGGIIPLELQDPSNEMVIIAAWAAVVNPYPITRGVDYTQSNLRCDLLGQTVKGGYDSHFVLVDRQGGPGTLDYQARPDVGAGAPLAHEYSELVLKDEAQVMARFVLRCRKKSSAAGGNVVAEEETAKKEAEAEEKAKKEAEEKAKKEAEEKAKKEAEEKAKQEAEEKAKQEAEEKAKQEAEEKAKQEAEEKAKKEAGSACTEIEAKRQLAKAILSMLNIGSTMLSEDKDKARASFLRVLALDSLNPTARLALGLLDLYASAQEGNDEAGLKQEKMDYANSCLTAIAEVVVSNSGDNVGDSEALPVHVIFLGMVDAGKSTLINSILSTQLQDFPQDLGHDFGNGNFLQVAEHECTSVITEVRMGKQKYSLSRDGVRQDGTTSRVILDGDGSVGPRELSLALRAENEQRPDELANEYGRVQISLKESFDAELPQNVVLVDCSGTNNSNTSIMNETNDVHLMLDYIPKQILVYVVSFTDFYYGVDGCSARLLQKMRHLENQSVIVPTFVFTNFATVKDRWTTDGGHVRTSEGGYITYKEWRKRSRRESDRKIKSLDDDLHYFFLQFLRALKQEGWDEKSFRLVCLDAHHALESEQRCPDLDSEPDEAEEAERLDDRQKSRDNVGVFWRVLLGSSESVALQRAEINLSRSLQALIWNTFVPEEKSIRKVQLVPVVPPDLHGRVRAAQASQMEKLKSHVRNLFPRAGLNKDEKYTEQQLEDGNGLKKGLRIIIRSCIQQQNEQKNTKWDKYIETCVQRSLSEFEYQFLQALANVQCDISNKIRDEIVAIALGAVDLTEKNAKSKLEMLNEQRKRDWAPARFESLSLCKPVSASTATSGGFTSPGNWGIWTYPQARPEVYHICISNVMKRKHGLISSIITEQERLFDAHTANFLQAKFPFNDVESWLDYEALIREYAIRTNAQQKELRPGASVDNAFLFKHDECEKSFAAALARFRHEGSVWPPES